MVGKGLAGFGWLQGADPHGGLCGVYPLLPPGACRPGMRLSQRPSSGACGPEPICMGAINKLAHLVFCAITPTPWPSYLCKVGG